MALWTKVQQLPQDALRQIQPMYNTCFPFEIRHRFAQWIEEQPWSEIDETNPAHEQFAASILNSMLQEINDKVAATQDFLIIINLESCLRQISDMYSDNPLRFVQVVKTCLKTESDYVNATETLSTQGVLLMRSEEAQQTRRAIKKEMDDVEQTTHVTDQELRGMQSTQERFVIDYQNQTKLQANLNHIQQQPMSASRSELENKLKIEKEEMDRLLLSAAQQILQQRLKLASKHQEILTRLDALQKKVVDEELIKWKRHQQLALNGAPFDNSMIDVLQHWCEHLAELIWRSRQQIIKVDGLRQQLPIDVPQGYSDIQPSLNTTVTGLLSSLVTSTFIVEEQPPQVLKKDSRFTATVRLLVGGKLNLNMTPPRVKATIISEQQARGLLQTEETKRQQKCGDILNNEGPMDYHSNTGQLSIKFRNMSLKNIRRADRRGAEVHTVAEEKFCILFTSEFYVGGNELKFQVWTLSLPVIVTVHGNQECQATATYLWDNQFSEPGRIPFVVPDQVLWKDLAMMLSTKFCHMTGKGLSEDNLQYLANKLFNQVGRQDYSQAIVTWAQFNKENLPTRTFTFWDWFWAVGKLVREHLKAPWNDETIVGFMDKTDSNEKLLARPNGTFLLRFSDGTQGGITIAWVADSPEKAGEPQVWNLAPFTIKDFGIRGLADRIKDLVALVNLYPDTPKDNAFSKYYSPASDANQGITQGGYVQSTLINVIDQRIANQTASPMSYDNPQTPQAMPNPLSPQSTYSHHPLTPRQDSNIGSQNLVKIEANVDVKIETNVDANELDQADSDMDVDPTEWLSRYLPSLIGDSVPISPADVDGSFPGLLEYSDKDDTPKDK